MVDKYYVNTVRVLLFFTFAINGFFYHNHITIKYVNHHKLSSLLFLVLFPIPTRADQVRVPYSARVCMYGLVCKCVDARGVQGCVSKCVCAKAEKNTGGNGWGTGIEPMHVHDEGRGPLGNRQNTSRLNPLDQNLNISLLAIQN